MTKSDAARKIDARVAEFDDWRGALLARLRGLVTTAAPGIVEEWKWSVPVWSHAGLICTGEVYKRVVKVTFARGAALPDPAKLFNASLGGNTRRAIDFHEDAVVDPPALQALVRAAVALNTAGPTKSPTKKSTKTPTKKPRVTRKSSPRRGRR